MKSAFKYNNNGVKDSIDQYRNIKGIHYECWTSDNNIFEQEKAKAKELNLKCRVIKGELYMEVKLNAQSAAL